jgi:hypothetical protein
LQRLIAAVVRSVPFFCRGLRPHLLAAVVRSNIGERRSPLNG